MDRIDESILTGSLITEDFFDNIDNSDIASLGTSSGDVIEDEGCRMEFQIEVIRGAKFSFRKKAIVLEKILKSSPIFIDAKVAACELKDDIDTEREKKEWPRHEIPYSDDTIWKYLGDYRPNTIGVTVSFDVALEPANKCPYEKFYKYMEELKEELGRQMPYHPDNNTRMYIYNTDKPDEYAGFVITGGYTDNDNVVKKTFEILWGDSPSDDEFKFNADRLLQNINFLQKVRNSVDSYNSIKDRSYTIEIGDSRWLTDKCCVIPVNMEPNYFDSGIEKSMGYIVYLVERVIGRTLPDVLLRNKYIALSIRVGVDEIIGINNKKCLPVGRDGRIPSRNGNALAETYQNFPVLMSKGTKKFETNRFQDIMYMRNNMRFYMMFPLSNGYISKDSEILSVTQNALQPFINNKI
jgi:hypothetical protein